MPIEASRAATRLACSVCSVLSKTTRELRIGAECHKLGGVDTRQTILAKLSMAFSPQIVEVIDESAAHAGHAGNTGGGHFHLRMATEAFRGKSAIERHRMVYQALYAELRERAIHALSMELSVPDEAEE